MNWTQHKNITVNLSPLSAAAAAHFFSLHYFNTHHVRKIFIRNAICKKLHRSVSCRLEIPLALYFIAVDAVESDERRRKKSKKCI